MHEKVSQELLNLTGSTHIFRFGSNFAEYVLLNYRVQLVNFLILILKIAVQLTRNSIANSDKYLLKICKVTPGRLEHVHKAVNTEIFNPN